MAACTALPAAPVCGGPPPRPKLRFTADHPFLYFVADKSGSILFLGTVVDDFQEYASSSLVSFLIQLFKFQRYENLCDFQASPHPESDCPCGEAPKGFSSLKGTYKSPCV